MIKIKIEFDEDQWSVIADILQEEIELCATNGMSEEVTYLTKMHNKIARKLNEIEE
jgi:hypothetical protein